MTKAFIAALCVSLLAAPAQSQSPATDAKQDAAKDLAKLFSDYDEQWLKLNPAMATMRGDHRYNDRLGNSLTAEHLSATEKLNRDSLDRLESIDPNSLSDVDRVSYHVFRYERELDLEGITSGATYARTLLPVDQIGCIPIYLAMFGSGSMVQPFRTVQDYENWIKRSAAFEHWVDDAIANMRLGAEQRVVLPTVIANKAIPVLAAHTGPSVERSVFYQPITKMPDGITGDDAKRLEAKYREHITQTIVPAYKKLHDFLAEEYMPRTRSTVGFGALPGGPEWYAFFVKQQTTTNMSPAEIHEIGKARLVELTREMEAIKERVGFDGSLAEFFVDLRTNAKFHYSREEDLIAAYEEVRGKVNPQLSKLFNTMPKSDYLIRQVESFLAPSAPGAQYVPGTPDGQRPGVFYVNTYKLEERPNFEVETLSLHEAAPGHHFQLSIAQEIDGLPAFRRFSVGDSRNAYIEGWGLYAESLGDELGLYTDPYQRLGTLTADALRCCRLVVDTGIHAFGWTREQAIEQMKQATPLSDQDITAEVERYIAWPGQALGYKIGQLKIRELRTRSEQALGDELDIREFHDVVLKLGALPLMVLESEVDRWLASKG